MIIPILGPSECRVWWTCADEQPISDLIWPLSESERSRAAGYRREEDRRRFVAAGWLLRTVAAAQLAASPADIIIERRCADCGKNHGKPRIVTDSHRELHASISHSGTRVGVALCTAGMVGVDVEDLSPAPGGIAYCALSSAEQAALSRLPEHERETGFVEMWVRKEAALKATGHGLQIPPEQVEVTGPRQSPAVLSWPLDVPPDRLRLWELDPGPGFAGVVAVLGGSEPVSVSESYVGGCRPAGRTDRTLVAV